jgi:hypothetical protein
MPLLLTHMNYLCVKSASITTARYLVRSRLFHFAVLVSNQMFKMNLTGYMVLPQEDDVNVCIGRVFHFQNKLMAANCKVTFLHVQRKYVYLKFCNDSFRRSVWLRLSGFSHIVRWNCSNISAHIAISTFRVSVRLKGKVVQCTVLARNESKGDGWLRWASDGGRFYNTRSGQTAKAEVCLVTGSLWARTLYSLRISEFNKPILKEWFSKQSIWYIEHTQTEIAGKEVVDNFIRSCGLSLWRWILSSSV